jgi:hypothetical protein
LPDGKNLIRSHERQRVDRPRTGTGTSPGIHALALAATGKRLFP